MKISVLISLIGLLLALVGSVLLLFAISYKEIQNVSFNRIEVNGKVVSEDKATTISINKIPYYLGLSFLILGFLLQAIGLLINSFGS